MRPGAVVLDLAATDEAVAPEGINTNYPPVLLSLLGGVSRPEKDASY